MNLTDKGIKVIVEVNGNVLSPTLKTKENKKVNSSWLILLLAVISTFVLFPESKETFHNYFKQYEDIS